MDPASFAFGVVSLAMQLVQTTRAIKDLISAYKSAAKELENLSNKLDDIETVCYSLEAVLSDVDNPAQKPWETTLLNKLHRIIRECYDKVMEIHTLINKISSRQQKGRNPLRTTGLLFLQYRDDIRVCTDGLDRSLSSLQLQMTANILPHPAITSSPTMEQLSAQARINSYDKSHLVGPESEVVTETWKRGWDAVAFVQKTMKRTTMTDLLDSRSSTIQEDSIFTLSSPLLNLYVKFSMRCGSLAPFCVALQMPRVIHLVGSLGAGIDTAFEDDDLQTVRRLFNEGVLAPATIITRTEYDPDNETTLLGLAVAQRAKRVFNFLVSRSPDLYQRNHISIGVYMYRCIEIDEDMGPVLHYINMRKELITPPELENVLRAIDDVHHFRSCIAACKQYFPSSWEPFNNMIWEYIVSKFSDYDDGLLEGWELVIADTIAEGLDIHRPLRPENDLNTLNHILRYRSTNDTAIEKMHRWIDMLEAAGVNTEQYLQIETERCFAVWEEAYPLFEETPSNYRRVLYIEHSRGRRFPCWAKVIEKSCSCRELFQEFPHLVYQDTLSHLIGPRDTMLQYQSWKDGTFNYPYVVEKSWPIWPPLQPNPTYREYMQKYEESRILADKWIDDACRLMESRFERKQMRKQRKAGYKGELRKQKSMPGAWVEEN
ncbi:hypothetical protein FOBRF1_013319 [Fusarium oxysporum]